MTHRFIVCEQEIYTLDNAAERTVAREAIREAGLDSLPIFEGPAGEAGEETGETLTAAPAAPDTAELPGDRELAEMIGILLNPECGESERMDVVCSLSSCGEVSIRSFRDAGILTNNEGLVLAIGDRTYQITVVS